MITITPTTDKITTDLEDISYCLDGHSISVNDATAVFIKVKYTIDFAGETLTPEYSFFLKKGYIQFFPGEHIQPYVTLREAQVSEFLNNFTLDIAPASVSVQIITQDAQYKTLQTFVLSCKFHAGYSDAIPEDGAEIYRSLSYNSVLPLAYRYPGQNVEFKFKEKTVTLNKQAESASGNIFQIMFFQVKGGLMSPPQFSDDFGDDFANGDDMWGVAPLPMYEEGYVHEINSSYNVRGINFPFQDSSVNILWLDESNIFRAITLTGKVQGVRSWTHYINQNAKNFRYRKAGATAKRTKTIDSGWKLQSETDLLKSLGTAVRGWMFGDSIADLKEFVFTSEKVTDIDSKEQRISFELEFEVNE